MRSISSLVSVCFAPLADKSRQRLPHDFGHVSESVECILFVLYHVAWRDQQMSWKPKLFGHATCPKTVQGTQQETVKVELEEKKETCVELELGQSE